MPEDWTHDWTQASARDTVAALKRGDVTPLELIDQCEARITAVDDELNALPTRCFDRAREHARHLMSDPKRQQASVLAGLPIAIKDLSAVAGVRTTYGSPIFDQHIPQTSDLEVQTLEANGAIVVAKSNTPEFGAGASTFNEVFGKTRNPWHTGKSVSGSSGGSAAALAAGQVWAATGSDLGGSLRLPASFNSVVGLRPSPGRVAQGPRSLAFDQLSVTGPMARNVADCALMLDAMCGFDTHDPLSFHSHERFIDAAMGAEAPFKVAFSADLGVSPVEPVVVDICRRACGRFAELGAEVSETGPDFSGASESFQTLRAALFAADMADHLQDNRDLLKPEVIWNAEKGLKLTAADIGRAENSRSTITANTARFFDAYDLLATPCAPVAPFDVDWRYVEKINGEVLDNYIQWLALTFAITLTGCPALSLPAGFTDDGLPIGVQLIGPPRGEAKLLAAANALEQHLGLAQRVPVTPKK